MAWCTIPLIILLSPEMYCCTVSAYPALVETLQELMPIAESTMFVMSWNRRMKESPGFFELMEEMGFSYRYEGARREQTASREEPFTSC